MTDTSNLIDTIDSSTSRIRTRSLDISFNELWDMHSTGELVINPAFQRLFRWNQVQRSQFIESLLLELPLPPIFVLERDDGIFDLIDGLQRISSYLHFRGNLEMEKVELDDGNDDESPSLDDDEQFLYDDDLELEDLDVLNKGSLVLKGCDIQPELNGMKYSDLPVALQIKMKRHTIRMEVVRKQSNPQLRYHMFKRLNRGGSQLSDQEVRNATIRLLDDRFVNFISNLAEDRNFIRCTRKLTPLKKQTMYRQELVLRYLALKNYRDKYIHHVGPFLTDYMEAVSDDATPTVIVDYAQEERVFRETFRWIVRIFDDRAFATINPQGNPMSNFSVYHYEAATLSISQRIGELSSISNEHNSNIYTALIQFKGSSAFKKVTKGGGLNYPQPLDQRLVLFQDAISDVISQHS